MTKKTLDSLKRIRNEILEFIEKPIQLMDKLRKVSLEESTSKEALESGLAKLIRKIHKNKEGKFSKEATEFAKNQRIKWRDSGD